MKIKKKDIEYIFFFLKLSINMINDFIQVYSVEHYINAFLAII